MQLSEEEVLGLMSRILRSDATKEGDQYIFGQTIDGQNFEKLPAARVQEVVDSLPEYSAVNDACLVNSRAYEVIVRSDARGYATSRALEEGFKVEDGLAGISYEIGPASPSFAVYMAKVLSDHEGGRPLRNMRRILRPMARRGEALEPFSAFVMTTRIRTLRIVSGTPRSPSFWKPLADSFIFHIGYNLDLAVMPQPGIDDLLDTSRIPRIRRSTVQELDPPRRHYLTDLVHHYQLGISADSPMLKYLSLYHVAEHWFENIFQDDLAEQVQKLITSPDFSYRRKNDIKNLIKKVSKAIQLRDEEVVINERVALRLTLDKYLNVDQLVQDLTNFDSSLVVGYASGQVSFSGGDAVELTGSNRGEAIAALASRIYKTRNSLVHSKDGAKGKFVPFADDSELALEIPLMRFIAEQIIVASSKLVAAS